MVRCGKVWWGSVRYGKAGKVGFGAVRCGMVR